MSASVKGPRKDLFGRTQKVEEATSEYTEIEYLGEASDWRVSCAGGAHDIKVHEM